MAVPEQEAQAALHRIGTQSVPFEADPMGQVSTQIPVAVFRSPTVQSMQLVEVFSHVKQLTSQTKHWWTVEVLMYWPGGQNTLQIVVPEMR